MELIWMEFGISTKSYLPILRVILVHHHHHHHVPEGLGVFPVPCSSK
jgi:hypothetical protein